MIEVKPYPRSRAPRCPLCLADASRGRLTACAVCGAEQHAACVRELGGCHPPRPRRAPRTAAAPPRRHPIRSHRRRRRPEVEVEVEPGRPLPSEAEALMRAFSYVLAAAGLIAMWVAMALTGA